MGLVACLGLTIAGGAFEIVGFGLVAAELARIQWAEFGTPRFVQRLQGRVRRLVGRGRVISVSGGVAGEADLAGRLSIREGA